MRKLVSVALQWELAIVRACFFLAPFITLIAPKAAVPVLVLLFLCCAGLALAHGARASALFRVDLGLALFGIAAAYLFINATWSADPGRAAGKAAWFATVAVMGFAACRGLNFWPRPLIGKAATAFLVGLAVCIVLILVEVLTDRFLTRSIYNLLPFTRPESIKGLAIKDGEVRRIAAFGLNHNVAVMLLALWPALLFIVTRLGGLSRWLGASALFLATAAAVFLSEHESSKAGFVLSIAAFAAACAWPVWTGRAVWAGWGLAFLLVVPLATLAHKAELHHADWLEYSAKARVVLWAYTAEQVPKAPILGIGGSSTRKMNLDPKTRAEVREERQEGKSFGWRAGAHTHNAFLQTWYELGAIGVILFFAAGSTVILSVRRLPLPTQRYLIAHIVTYLTILAFGWGMWQSWLMALAGLAGVYGALAVNLYRDQGG